MTKTHWVALVRLALSVSGLSEVASEQAVDALAYLLDAAFTATLLHRAWKIRQARREKKAA